LWLAEVPVVRAMVVRVAAAQVVSDLVHNQSILYQLTQLQLVPVEPVLPM